MLILKWLGKRKPILIRRMDAVTRKIKLVAMSPH